MAALVHSAMDVAALIAASARPDCGAVNVFLGTTRDHHAGRRVLRLAYEAYEAMAITALEKIEREAVEKFEVATCTIVHRLGDVPLAEASVAVIVCAAHRGPRLRCEPLGDGRTQGVGADLEEGALRRG